MKEAKDDKKDVVYYYYNNAATTEIYTLTQHDPLPNFVRAPGGRRLRPPRLHHARRALLPPTGQERRDDRRAVPPDPGRSEEHTSELQSRQYLVCRLLLEKTEKVSHLCH